MALGLVVRACVSGGRTPGFRDAAGFAKRVLREAWTGHGTCIGRFASGAQHIVFRRFCGTPFFRTPEMPVRSMVAWACRIPTRVFPEAKWPRLSCRIRLPGAMRRTKWPRKPRIDALAIARPAGPLILITGKKSGPERRADRRTQGISGRLVGGVRHLTTEIFRGFPQARRKSALDQGNRQALPRIFSGADIFPDLPSALRPGKGGHSNRRMCSLQVDKGGERFSRDRLARRVTSSEPQSWRRKGDL